MLGGTASDAIRKDNPNKCSMVSGILNIGNGRVFPEGNVTTCPMKGART